LVAVALVAHQIIKAQMEAILFFLQLLQVVVAVVVLCFLLHKVAVQVVVVVQASEKVFKLLEQEQQIKVIMEGKEIMIALSQEVVAAAVLVL